MGIIQALQAHPALWAISIFVFVPMLVAMGLDDLADRRRRGCHACWVDAERRERRGTSQGAVTSVILRHTCWRLRRRELYRA